MGALKLAGLGVVATIALAATGNAQTPTVDTIAVADVAAYLDSAGLRYEELTDDAGKPYIDVTPGGDMPGEQMAVIFYDCTAGACADMRLWSWYSLPTPVDVELINQWNSQQRWSKAYVDADNDPVLEMDIMGSGGVGRDAVEILMNTYISQMSEFADLIGYQ